MSIFFSLIFILAGMMIVGGIIIESVETYYKIKERLDDEN